MSINDIPDRDGHVHHENRSLILICTNALGNNYQCPPDPPSLVWNQSDKERHHSELTIDALNSPNFKASDLGMLVVAVGRVIEVAGAALLAARLCIDSW